MLYAILAYHAEDEVASWSADEDAALMLDLNKVHDRLTAEKCLGPAARLGSTEGATTSIWWRHRHCLSRCGFIRRGGMKWERCWSCGIRAEWVSQCNRRKAVEFAELPILKM